MFNKKTTQKNITLRKSISGKVTKSYTTSTLKFIEKAEKVHGNKFDYSKSIYLNSLTNVIIRCIKCGDFFEQTPKVHLRGGKCTSAECKKNHYEKIGNLTRLTSDLFIEKAKQIHGDKYDYSKCVYVRSHSKVEIYCNLCNIYFYQKPNNHLANHGCVRCKNYFVKPNWSSKVENEWLDTIKLPTTFRQKFLYCNGNVSVDALVGNTVYEFYGSFWHGDPRVFDHNSINTKNGIPFRQLYQKTIERHKRILDAGYEIKFVWEYDYKNGMLQSENHPL